MPVFRRESVELNYLDVGEGTPVLLLHPFPLNSDVFLPQAEGLRGVARVIAPDMRGFGKSGRSAEVTTMEMMAQDALALLDHLGVETAVVGGVSMGGYVSMAILREDPSRVRALVLADTQAGADDAAGKERRETMAEATLAEGIEHLLRVQVPGLLSKHASVDLRARVEAIARTTSAQGAAAALRGMGARPDSKPILARFGCPTLVVVGADDALTPPAKAKEMAELVSGSKLVEIADAGHLANLERSQEFNATLREFLESVPAGT